MATKSNGVDLGALQKRYENAVANDKNTARALSLAEAARVRAKKELAAASEALDAGVKSVTAS